MAALKCPYDGAERNTVEELADHLWRYHSSLNENIAVAKWIFELADMIPRARIEGFLKWAEDFNRMVDIQYRDVTGTFIMKIKEELLNNTEKVE